MGLSQNSVDDLIPWFVCFAILSAILVFGLLSSRSINRGGDDFLTGGRGFGPIIVMLSIFSTSNTGFMFVGAIGAGYAQGLSALWLALAWCIGETAFWMVFPPKINDYALRKSPVSVPDYIAKAAPDRQMLVRLAAGLVVAATTLPFIVAQNVAAGKAIASVADLSLSMSVFVAGGALTGIALVYCVWGGLKASMMANALQGASILLIGAVLFIIVLLQLLATGAPVDRLLMNNPDVFDPFATTPLALMLFFLLGGATASFGGAASLPTVLMRVSVADSPKTLQNIKWVYIGTCYLFLGAMMLMGVMLSGLVSDAPDPEQSLFVFSQSLSPWVLGLALGGAMVLILSTLDGSILVGGAALSDDVWGDRASNRSLVRLRRGLGILIFSSLALALGVLLANRSVFQIILFGLSAMAGGIGPVFIIATLGLKTNHQALIATMIVGVITAVAWSAFGLSEYVGEAFPSFVAGLMAHQLVAKLGKSKTVSSLHASGTMPGSSRPSGSS
ncbi:MAG: hypothetical protein AAF224_05960 [Pseudomonadota bacterium]